MAKFVDIVRMIIISPELAVAFAIVLADTYIAGITEFIFTLFQAEEQWPIAAIVGIPLALLIGNYKIGGDLLSPHGKRKVLLEWPEYWRLKFRVVYCLIVCAVAFVVNLFGYYAVHKQNSQAAALLIVIAWAVAASTTASIALAKWRVREILGE